MGEHEQRRRLVRRRRRGKEGRRCSDNDRVAAAAIAVPRAGLRAETIAVRRLRGVIDVVDSTKSVLGIPFFRKRQGPAERYAGKAAQGAYGLGLAEGRAPTHAPRSNRRGGRSKPDVQHSTGVRRRMRRLSQQQHK